MEVIEKMRSTAPDQFHCLVKMHLSFLLDIATDECDCSFVYSDQGRSATPSKKRGVFSSTPKRKPGGTTKGVMDGASLTLEGVCQAYQIIEYLQRPDTLKTVGIFRKHGNLKKQQALKERLNKGITVDLDSGEFSIFECAATLKAFLSDLPEPLLSDAYYKAHCQVASKITDDAKKTQCLQLLFMLIPEASFALLKDVLSLLHQTAMNAEHNKMDASNLATLFATHILCPRKLSPDCLQSNHQLYIKAVAFMIENADVLFEVPPQLLKDAEIFCKTNKFPSDPIPIKPGASKDDMGSPVVNTVYSFVDRERTKAAASKSTTETALAELYAQVQAMPESAKKKSLIQRLNDANGYGTPSLSTKKRPGGTSRLKNLLTPSRTPKQAKEGRSRGSYRPVFEEAELFATPSSSFKRQISREQNQPMTTFVGADDDEPAVKIAKPPKPPPPPRTTSLPSEAIAVSNPEEPEAIAGADPLMTPRSRRPVVMTDLASSSPALALPDHSRTSGSDENGSDISKDVSVNSSVISEEARQLLAGDMDPSDSMCKFLDGKTPCDSLDDDENNENSSPIFSPNSRKERQRSITELGGPTHVPKPKLAQNNDKVYFETDL